MKDPYESNRTKGPGPGADWCLCGSTCSNEWGVAISHVIFMLVKTDDS